MMEGAAESSGGAPLRIAMWSGPRNLSTAMMRAFGNRPDTSVADEPFYAAYLKISGAKHPMREEILRNHETDWRKVADFVAGAAPGSKPVFYQKHMTHHMLPEIGRGWMAPCRHAFLIRHPARVLASYAAKREAVTLGDIGFVEQAELFDHAAAIAGRKPVVIDADAVLADPRDMLAKLCGALGLAFTDCMLSWPPGPRDTDGVWAAHWYDAVNRSGGFGEARPLPHLQEPRLRALLQQALPIYLRLAEYALR